MFTNHKHWYGTFRNEEEASSMGILDIYQTVFMLFVVELLNRYFYILAPHLIYIYTNYIFLESTYNTDSHSKISAVGKDFENS